MQRAERRPIFGGAATKSRHVFLGFGRWRKPSWRRTGASKISAMPIEAVSHRDGLAAGGLPYVSVDTISVRQDAQP